MRRYFIGIGSNINPKENLPRILEKMLGITPVLYLSRVIETEPDGDDLTANFLNCAASFVSEMNETTLKGHFNQIEAALGRNRSNPNRKNTDRTADLDILFWMNTDLDRAPTQSIPVEPYLRPQTIELVTYLGISCGIPLNTLPRGIPLQFNGTPFGTHVVTLER